ncbi:RAMP superfamily CRISPR-associated protein [Archaeoglobus neptunius]|uniref:RAMP superfamily CRISPR-associated protein n=1 Tax=Archaeoglobus neptunius TaxID=2798580 RepID=UPI001925BB39|nr:RAMP superfamily CRISPR-associated protein [Archaeoglobus neptunius]
MTWKCYLTIFKAESPVHIGYRQIGILKTTRYYITGRAMWGAITANLTRALFSSPDAQDYQAVGNFVRKNIRTTYFYPAIKKDTVKDPEKWSECKVEDYLVFMPEYTDEGLKFGKKTKEEFEQTFIDSFVSTALEPQTKTAEEGSLHEFEYIRNKINIGGKATQVYWIGYLFVKHNTYETKDNQGKRVYRVELKESGKDIEIKFKNEITYKACLKGALNPLFVGGERNYGFGRLTPESDFVESQRLFGKFTVKLNANEPIMEIDTAFAHLDLEGAELKGELLGEIEPVVGLEWSDEGAGQRISSFEICALPGSKIGKSYIKVGNYGILKR